MNNKGEEYLVLNKQEFIERAMKIKFKITSPVDIRNRFLKLLEDSAVLGRNSISFNQRDHNFSFLQENNDGGMIKGAGPL